MTTIKKSRFLSCESGDLQCFLSCILRSGKQNPTTLNLNLKRKSVFGLSCEAHTAPESQIEIAPNYRANESKLSRKHLIIGIDPGITGAMAIISNEASPKLVAVYDFPTREVKIGKQLKTRIDLESLSFIIESYSKDINLACIEEVGQIGTNADPFSSFVFGFATGSVHGILASNSIRIETVKPSIWKAALGLDADKQKSLDKAKKFFPLSEKFLTRKKDHGRAEAILIAHFAWMLMGVKA